MRVLYDLKEERILTFDQMCFLKKNITNNFLVISEYQEAITDFTNVLLRNLFLQKNDVSILIYDLNNTKIKHECAIKTKQITLDVLKDKDLIVFPEFTPKTLSENLNIMDKDMSFIFCASPKIDTSLIKKINKNYSTLFLDKTKKPYFLKSII